MSYGRTLEETYKVYLCLGGVGLALAWRQMPRRYAIGALAALTLFAGVNNWRADWKTFAVQADSYDLVHYYLNAKYWDELRYADLYPAALRADFDNGGPYFDPGPAYMQQGNGPDKIRPVEEALARGEVVKREQFTPERWAAFTHDVLYLERDRDEMSRDLWKQMIQDHGYNGAPAWTAIARPLASWVPVEQIKALCMIDPALLLVALVALAWAYDSGVALWAALFLFVTYSTRWPVIGWAFLRYDYVAGLMIAMALLKKGRELSDTSRYKYAAYAVAGLFASWSATLRLFPAAWLFGPAAKGVVGLIERKVHKPLLVLAAGFLLGAATLEGYAVLQLGPTVITEHLADMKQHTAPSQLSSRRVGLALALPYRGELLPKNITKDRKAEVEAQRPVQLAIAGLTMFLLGAGMRREKDDEAFAWGFLPLFLLTTASYYYYVTRVTLVIAHAANLDKRRHVAGLAALLGIELFCNKAETGLPEHRVFLVGWLAWLLCAYTVFNVGALLWEAWRKEPAQSSASSTVAE